MLISKKAMDTHDWQVKGLTESDIYMTEVLLEKAKGFTKGKRIKRIERQLHRHQGRGLPFFSISKRNRKHDPLISSG